MGFRFQKRIKIIPGVTVNLSKSGLSTSVGTTGARVTLGHGKTRTTVGLPGSGISHTSITSSARPINPGSAMEVAPSISNKKTSYLSMVLSVAGKVLVAASLVGVALIGIVLAFSGKSSKRRR